LLSFFSIAEDGIGLADLLETLLGLTVVGFRSG
jgi:hypothetical protein